MTPGARLQAAIEILGESFAAPLPADAIADAYFRRRRYAGSADRRAIQERMFGILRRKARLEWHIARASAAPPSPRALALADLIVGDGLDADVTPLGVHAHVTPLGVHAHDAARPACAKPERLRFGEGRLFGSSPHAPMPLSVDETALARALEGSALDDPAMPDPVRLEYPAWLEQSLRVAFGDRLAEEMSALNRQAPLDLRVNAIKGTRDAALAALAAEGVAAEPTPLSPWGLRVMGAVRTRSCARRAPNVRGTRAFKQGLVEVQDEGSQIVAALVGARAGMTVVDFCAGAGGKTLALAAAMARNGRIEGRLVACDTSPERLERMTARLARAGARDVERIALEDETVPALRRFASAADRVLLDVPCSASGAWRRDPLGKWRLSPEQLDRLVASQRRILAAAARLVRPGGRLVYATCSVLPEENEAQVALFLERHDEFQVIPMARIWGETLPGAPPSSTPFLRLTPAAHGTDGFFAAVLERRPPRG